LYFPKKLQDLLSIGSSNTITPIINGTFWLFIASILTKTDYGELGFLFSIVNVVSVVSLLGLATTILVYGAKKENIFPASFVIVLVTSIIASSIAFLFTENIIASLLIIGLTIFNLTLSGLLSKEKYHKYSYNQLIKAGSAVILALIFYQFLGINGILLGYFVSTLFIMKELYALLKNKKIEFSILKPKIRFLLQNYAARIVFITFWWADKLIIGTMFGFTFLAGYYFASQYIMLLMALPKTITQYLLPQEAQGKKNKKIKIFSVLFVSLISIASIIFLPWGINTFLPKFEESILPMQIMSIALFPIAISAILQAQFLGKENSQIILIGGIIEVTIYLGFIIVLGPIYGLVGLAIGFLVAQSLKTCYNLLVTYWNRSSDQKSF